MGKGKKKQKRSRTRRASVRLGIVLLVLIAVWGAAGEWFVHHSRAWIAARPKWQAKLFTSIGNPLADFTDALDLTGYDTICEYDAEAPKNSVTFAGAPRRVGAPAPNSIRILDRGNFLLGWSDKLRHPVWCAYHVTRDALHMIDRRPSFAKDKSEAMSPAPGDYTRSGYDRGHMAPNHAISSRYGVADQKRTFQMTNITPQSPALNRGVWRDMELRIADLWTARYGEIWVVVGCLPSESGEALSGTNIDVPSSFYQIVIAQEGFDVRALAVLFPQSVGWHDWPARYLVTIEELEKLTGLDFNPELPDFFAKQLEGDLPSRLWPIRKIDIFRQIALRFL